MPLAPHRTGIQIHIIRRALIELMIEQAHLTTPAESQQSHCSLHTHTHTRHPHATRIHILRPNPPLSVHPRPNSALVIAAIRRKTVVRLEKRTARSRTACTSQPTCRTACRDYQRRHWQSSQLTHRLRFVKARPQAHSHPRGHIMRSPRPCNSCLLACLSSTRSEWTSVASVASPSCSANHQLALRPDTKSANA